jgi:hypothetical protein
MCEWGSALQHVLFRHLITAEPRGAHSSALVRASRVVADVVLAAVVGVSVSGKVCLMCAGTLCRHIRAMHDRDVAAVTAVTSIAKHSYLLGC